MPRVLLLMPNATYRAEAFLEAAARVGADVVVGSDRCERIHALWKLPGVTMHFHDVEGAVAAIADAATAARIDAVLATDDATVEIAARASAALGLPHNPPDAARASRDKAMLRERLGRTLLQPAARTFPAGADVRAIAAEAPYPCVLKPLHLSASRGVIRADDPGAFVAAFERIGALLARPSVAVRRDPAGDRILVEEYVPGAEHALEGLLRAGRLETLALFDKPDPLEGPFFEETLYVTPSRLPEPLQLMIGDVVARGARALGLREGPVHAEVRLNERGVWLIELAARAIGGLCSRALHFGAGFTLEELLLRHALGLPIESTARERGAAGAMMLPIPRAGVLKSVAGEVEARAVPGVEDVAITAPIGAEIEPLPEGDRYLGFVIARAETPAAVERALRAAHARLSFEIAPALPVRS